MIMETLMSRRLRSILVCAALIPVAAACGGGQPQQDAQTATAPAADEAPPLPGEGTITGRITFEGPAPKMQVIRMTSDPLCMSEGASSEILLVGPENGLQNVFVYVKDGLGDRTFPAPKTPVVLDQQGCVYRPHVFGVQVGQPVRILNSDNTLHNVNARAKQNAEFNFAQTKKGTENIRTFSVPEIMVPFRCDVHGWMNAYAGVVPHPFFAVTSADGSFEIKGLPAGTYTLEAWHERLGTQTASVTSDGKTPVTASFTFKGEAS
jgi:plastocyanin